MAPHPIGDRSSRGSAGACLAVDVLFAVDPVAAILAITDDACIVFAANAPALLGPRPLVVRRSAAAAATP